MIVHVASGREWRGGQHQVLLLAAGLHDAGVPTVVITGTATTLAARLRDAGVAVEEVGWRIGLDPRVAIRLLRLVRPDTIIHAHDNHAFALADAVTRIRRRPLVVTRRVIFPIHSPRRFRRAAAVIAISNAVRAEVARAGVLSDRIHLIPDAIDPAGIPDHFEDAGDEGGPVIACVAALEAEKGIDTLLDAAAIVRTIHPLVRWRIVGDGSERAALEAHRDRLDLAGLVEFTPPRAAYEAFAGAALAVQPSRSEGLGSAALQALACGVPLIVSDAGGLPDTVALGGGVIVPRDAPAELARVIDELLQAPEVLARLAAEGRAAARHFTVEQLVERTRRVYRSVASTRDGA
ncbi:MAG TPA: glycosyltransferase family 4 protein [Gemmatimonadales bacterium]|jgi:glycosyltransferase involved in cell wall biosynthesis